MIRSWPPASCRRHHLEIMFARGPAAPAASRARWRPLWICLALLLMLASGAAAQVPIPSLRRQAVGRSGTDNTDSAAARRRPAEAGAWRASVRRPSPVRRREARMLVLSRLANQWRRRRPRTVAHDGSKAPFDTLTVFNAALSFRLNWEGNFRDLGAQAESSLENPANYGDQR